MSNPSYMSILFTKLEELKYVNVNRPFSDVGHSNMGLD